MVEDKIKLLNALIEKPTSFEIEVLDNSMLPEDLKENKTISISVKPPSLETLTKSAIPVLKIPEELRSTKGANIDEAMKYLDNIAEAVAIVVHNKSTELPSWLIPFIKGNLTPKELYLVFLESVLKLQTDFFLSSFQIASKDNPMMMNKKKNQKK